MASASGNWTTVLVTIVFGLALFVVQRLFFHPLSRYPGPRLWALTRVPYVLSMRSGRLSHDIRRFHEKYGKAIRVAPNELAFIDPDAIRDIYARIPGRTMLPKDSVRFPPPKPGQTISILDALDDDHARIRKALSPPFSDRALAQQEPLVTSYVEKLVDRLTDQINEGNSVIDLQQWYSYCTFDIICSLAFGEDFGCMDKDSYHEWLGMLVYSLKAKVQMAACRFYPWLYDLLMMGIAKQAQASFTKHNAVTREKVQRRLETSVERPDFLNHFQTSKEGLTEREIETNAATLIVAGSHTLTTSLTGTTLQLLQHPDVLARAVKEIRGACSSPADLTNKTLRKLPYLSAVIQEGLRITSPVPLGLTRIIPEGGAIICGQWIPPKIIVSYMSWAANSSPSNFTEPHKFLPERWMDPSTVKEAARFANDRKDASQPFLLGPRDCLGQNLARLELRLILARMMYSFDMTAIPDANALDNWENQETYAVWLKTPLKAKLKIAA